MLLLQNYAVKRIPSVFLTFSLYKKKFIFVNNSLRPTFININFALVDHKLKVVFWLCLIHAPERICPSNQLAFFVFLTKLELGKIVDSLYTGTRNFFRCMKNFSALD